MKHLLRVFFCLLVTGLSFSVHAQEFEIKDRVVTPHYHGIVSGFQQTARGEDDKTRVIVKSDDGTTATYDASELTMETPERDNYPALVFGGGRDGTWTMSGRAGTSQWPSYGGFVVMP